MFYMTMTLAQIEKEVFQLPLDEQQKLVSDLQHNFANKDSLEGLDIALERARKIDKGEGSFMSLDTCMQRIHQKLNERDKRV
jgi:hypothetical protein